MRPVIYNGFYTVVNRATGEHRTFRIHTQKEDAKFAPGMRVISLLVGPDNTANYKGFGFVTDRGVLVWRKYRLGGVLWRKEGGTMEAYAKLVWALATRPAHPIGRKYELRVARHCMRCNRLLTEPTSIEEGVGPVCAGRA